MTETARLPSQCESIPSIPTEESLAICSKDFVVDSSWTHTPGLLTSEQAIEKFGGPGEIRTHDLFHAIFTQYQSLTGIPPQNSR